MTSILPVFRAASAEFTAYAENRDILPLLETGLLRQKICDLIGERSDPAGADDRSFDSFKSFLDRHGRSDAQSLRRFLANNQIDDALADDVMNSQQLYPAAERSEQASRAGGIEVNAPGDERLQIGAAALDDDEFQCDAFVVKISICPRHIDREECQSINGLRDPDRRLRPAGEIWNEEQKNQKKTDEPF